MILTGKKHIVDKTRLKPTKIQVPHALNDKADTTICLITADPQRLYKDVVADPAFPAALRTRITRIIGFEKLRTRYKSFESRRQLHAEHDFFLVDDRIMPMLPKTLGKIFYKGRNKRPLPVDLSGVLGPKKRAPGEIRRSTKHTDGKGAATPAQMSRDIAKALNSALVHLSTSNTTAIRVATARMSPEQCRDNIQSVMDGVTGKILPQGWRNVRAVHIKGLRTPAFPIWMTDELWANEADVLEAKKMPNKKRKRPAGTFSKTNEDGSATIAGRGVPGTESGYIGGALDNDNAVAERKKKLKKQKSDVIQAAVTVA